jgi:hypothetical protein
MRSGIVLIALLCLGSPALAVEFGPQFDLTTSVQDNTVVLELTARYSVCGQVTTVDRIDGNGLRSPVWTGSDSIVLEPFDRFVDCTCEPVGSYHGTSSKNCPEAKCTKDEQCACSMHCQPIEDVCPPAGSLTYELLNSDSEVLVTDQINLSANLPGCTAPVDDTEVTEPDGTGNGGCQTSSPAGMSLALLLGAIILLFWYRFRTAGLILVATIVCLSTPGCRNKKEHKTAAKNTGKDVVALEPVESNLEGTPFEAVITRQTELLDYFETGTSTASVLSRTRDFRLNHANSFRDECNAALAWYAQDSQHRLNQMVKAGQVWAVVKSRVVELTAEYSDAEKRDVAILLNEFSCR